MDHKMEGYLHFNHFTSHKGETERNFGINYKQEQFWGHKILSVRSTRSLRRTHAILGTFIDRNRAIAERWHARSLSLQRLQKGISPFRSLNWGN